MAQITTELADIAHRADVLERESGLSAISSAAQVRSHAPALVYEKAAKKREVTRLTVEMHDWSLRRASQADGSSVFYAEDALPNGFCRARVFQPWNGNWFGRCCPRHW